MDGDRIPAAPLDDDGAAQERADRRGLHIEPASEQRESRELRLEVRGAFVELRPTVDEEADDAPLEQDRVDVTELEGGQTGGGGRLPEGGQPVVPGVTLDQQDGRGTRPDERDHEIVEL